MLIKEGAVDTFGQYNNVVNPIQPIKSRVSTLREGERPELWGREWRALSRLLAVTILIWRLIVLKTTQSKVSFTLVSDDLCSDKMGCYT